MYAETYLEPSRTSVMDFFAKIVNGLMEIFNKNNSFKPLTIFIIHFTKLLTIFAEKSSIVNIQLGFQYVSVVKASTLVTLILGSKN